MRCAVSARPALRSIGFAVLFLAALLTTVLFFSGVADIPGHHGLYAAALATAWGFYFYFFPAAAGISFLHCVLCLVWSHP
jgi:hypothetical protein